MNATADSKINYTEASDVNLNRSVFNATDIGRSAAQQAGYQIAGLVVTISIAILR